jgi:hypothetical protein
VRGLGSALESIGSPVIRDRPSLEKPRNMHQARKAMPTVCALVKRR